MTGFEDHSDGPIEMIAASDGSVELLCREKTIRIEGKMLLDLFFRRETRTKVADEFLGYWSDPEWASEYSPPGWYLCLSIILGQERARYHSVSMSTGSAVYHGRKLQKVLRWLGSAL
jgi:hypothetical protein